MVVQSGLYTMQVDSGNLVNLARSLWTELEPRKAIHVISSAFPDLTQPIILAILTGSLTIVKDPETKEYYVDKDDKIVHNKISLSLVEDIEFLKEQYNKQKHGIDYVVCNAHGTTEDSILRIPTQASYTPFNCIPLGCTHGWLTPEGKFYACTKFEHLNVLASLGISVKYAEKYWLRFSNSKFEVYTCTSQKQYDFIYNWLTVNNMDTSILIYSE